jgi:predicted RNA-binding Zn ribbon-like protein
MADTEPATIVPPATDLCLCFVNTLAWRGRSHPSETIMDFNGLTAWLRNAAGTVDVVSSPKPARRSALLADAIAVREALFELFRAIAAGEPTPPAEFMLFQRALAAAPGRRHLIAHDAVAFAWQVEKMRPSMPHLLAPVLWSAADLIVSVSRRRVRLCANPECLWLFLDASRNATRLWCDMAACGNRAKARRHYMRSKQS